jgi:CheY-like chemotaxis protein
MGQSFLPGHRTLALIVDPADAERREYVEHLAQHGISTAEAQDSFHGIAKAASLLPDVIAVDLGMPRRDVVDLCTRLKRDDSTRHIPIIAVTENGTAAEVEQALRAGCASVLVKPCLPNVLLEEIHRVLGRSVTRV